MKFRSFSFRCLAFLLAFLPGVSLFGGTLGETWEWRNPLPQGNSLYGIAHGGDTFVAIGEAGTVLRSGNGETWSVSSTPTIEWLSGAAYGAGKFVVVGNNGTVLTSSGGTNWASQDSGTTAWLWDVAYLNGKFWAVGSGGTILSSTDGNNWSLHPQANVDFLRGIAFGAEKIVAVGDFGTVLSSADGEIWAEEDSGTPFSIHSITFADGKFVVVGATGLILHSETGSSWQPSNPVPFQDFWSVTYATNKFLTVGANGNLLTSTDAVTWTSRSSGVFNTLRGLAQRAGKIVAVGSGGKIIYSADGETWEQASEGVDNLLFSVTHAEGQYVATGTVGRILRSADSIAWTTQPSATTQGLLDVAHGKDTFVAVGLNGTIRRSIDGGESWQTSTATTSGTISSVAFGGGDFATVGRFGRIQSSPDGITWTRSTQDAPGWMRGVRYGDGLFVAVGDNGTIVTSPNATAAEWTSRNSGTTTNLHAVAHGDGKFIAVGRSGRIISSPDATTWTVVESGTTLSLESIAYGDGLWVAVGDLGIILTSVDGTEWFEQNSGTLQSLWGVAHTAGTFVVVGDGGTILVSTESGVPPPSGLTFAQWVIQKNIPAGQRGINDAPAGDGVSNLVKFVLGLEPLSPVSQDLPQLEIVSQGGQPALALRMTQATNISGAILTLEASTNLVDWQETPHSLQVIESLSQDLRLIRLVENAAFGSDERRFLRLRVTLGDTPDPEPTTFAGWVNFHNLPANQSGPSDSPAGDNVANLIKFAMGIDPMIYTNGSSLTTQSEVTVAGQDYMTLIFARSTTATGVEFILQGSDDLSSWVDLASVLTVLGPLDGDRQEVSLRDTEPKSSSRRFIRLVVRQGETATPEPNTFEGWASHHNLPANQSGPSDSPAGDNVANLFKFAMGIDPMVYTNGSSLTTRSDIIVDGEAYMTLTFARSTTATGVEFVLQGSDDLAVWVDLSSVLTTVGPLAGDREEVFLTDTEPKSSSRRFIRVSIRQIP